MTTTEQERIAATLAELYDDAKYDRLRMLQGAAKSIFRPMQPSDFEEAYLSISQEQGADLYRLVVENGIKRVVEFGTSFGISTLFLAQGVLETGGCVITTELLASKAERATKNFVKAGVADLIEVRVGDAMDTLKNHDEPIDLLFLDGWKDLYLPLFKMLEPGFHQDTIIYVDNADMADSQVFLRAVRHNSKYQLKQKYGGKAVLITVKK